MRISDWSSDVCSSDLARQRDIARQVARRAGGREGGRDGKDDDAAIAEQLGAGLLHPLRTIAQAESDARNPVADAASAPFVHHNLQNSALSAASAPRFSAPAAAQPRLCRPRSEEHTSELQSQVRSSSAVL